MLYMQPALLPQPTNGQFIARSKPRTSMSSCLPKFLNPHRTAVPLESVHRCPLRLHSTIHIQRQAGCGNTVGKRTTRNSIKGSAGQSVFCHDRDKAHGGQICKRYREIVHQISGSQPVLMAREDEGNGRQDILKVEGSMQARRVGGCPQPLGAS